MRGLWIVSFRSAFAVTLTVVTWLALTSAPLPAGLTLWDKGNHFMAFLVLAFLLDYSFPDPATSPIVPDWLKWLFLLAYGIGIECVQGLLGTRDFEVRDMLADAIGITGYLLVRPVSSRLPILRVLRGPGND